MMQELIKVLSKFISNELKSIKVDVEKDIDYQAIGEVDFWHSAFHDAEYGVRYYAFDDKRNIYKIPYNFSYSGTKNKPPYKEKGISIEEFFARNNDKDFFFIVKETFGFFESENRENYQYFEIYYV